MNTKPAYAVVRLDGPSVGTLGVLNGKPCLSNPTVKLIMFDLTETEREVERLNLLAKEGEKDCRYVIQTTRVQCQ